MQMRYIGYRFAQLGGVFFVHYPHQYSKTRAVWNVGWNLRKRIAAKKDALASNDWNNHDWTKVKKGQIDGIFVQFKEWMKDTLEDTSRVPMCDDAQDDEQMLWVA